MDREVRFIVDVRIRPKQATGTIRKTRTDGTHYQVPAQRRADANATVLGWAVAPFAPRVPLSGPIRANYRVLFAYPKRMPGSIRRAHYIPHPGPPDPDNLAKQISDVLQATGFFVDDRQVCRLEVSCEYWARDRLEVVLSPLPNPQDWTVQKPERIQPRARK